MASKNRSRTSSEKSESDKVNSQTPPIPIRRSFRLRSTPKRYSDFFVTSPSKRNIYKEPTSSDSDDENDTEISPSKPTASILSNDVEGQNIRQTKHDSQNKVQPTFSDSPRSLKSPKNNPRKKLFSPRKKTPKATPKILDKIKKTLILSDDEEGQNIFNGKTRQTKNNLQNKVQPRELKSNNTPRNTSASPRKKTSEATPKRLEKTKRRIISPVKSDSGDSDDNDFSCSGSDFIPDETYDESEQSSISLTEDEISPKKPVEVEINKRHNIKTRSKESEYIVKPDNYFMMNSTKKITTSDRTLALLKKLNLNENVNDDDHVSKEHKSKIKELNMSYKSLFDKWLFILYENFNIILYGVGSKRSVLQQFQMEKLQDFPCLVVNGFFPGVTINRILETIVIDLLENSKVPSNTADVINLIDSQLSENDTNLFIFIHNIDGTTLRKNQTQAILASVSQIRNVHVIATIDHVNAPLLWDNSKMSKFNFIWWDVTTFLPYNEEISYEDSIMTHQSDALQISSFKSVHESLTENCKKIFKIIIEYQLDHHKGKQYQGLPFKDLYSKCRRNYLVSSDTALRAQLTELLDHRLVKMKRTFDRNENLIIPIDNALLQQFFEEQNN